MVGLGALLAFPSLGAELAGQERPYPRIGNCYAAGLGYETWEKGGPYWSKLGLILGGGYDVHYDWEKPRWAKTLKRVEENIARLRKVNPHVIILPYVDVIEGPDNPDIPKHWWDLDAQGKRWSGWPGFLRINMKLPEVLQFNLDKVRTEIIGRPCFDGVFYDCWAPDPWLCPRTAQLRDGKAVVMVNPWNLPREGFDRVNGILSEDEYNRVIEGKVDFDDFLGRYLQWCRESRKPAVTMLVGHPQNMNMDPWHWAKVSWKQRAEMRKSLQFADLKTMRFGLCATLMGDGYFGYDTANLGRGDWWWYPEYDAPLGQPLGPAQRNADGTWQRRFTGGLVVVNGTLYDAEIQLPATHRNFSSDQVGARFTVPMFDGRILIPAPGQPAAGRQPPARITCKAPREIVALALDGGTWAVQTPGGLDLRFGPEGQLQHVLWHGRSAMSGGWPVVLAPNGSQYEPKDCEAPEVQSSAQQASLAFRGTLQQGTERVEYRETCRVRPDNSFTLRFEFQALSDLDVRMWRHYFAFPVGAYAGASARAGDKSATLPRDRAEGQILPAARKVVVESDRLAIAVEASGSFTLIDHRRYGTDEYLLAGYPVHGKVPAGKQWSVEITTKLAGARR